MISDYKQFQSSKLAKYKEMEIYMEKDEKGLRHSQKIYVLAPLRYGILVSEAVIKWCDEVISML